LKRLVENTFYFVNKNTRIGKSVRKARRKNIDIEFAGEILCQAICISWSVNKKEMILVSAYKM